MTRGDVGLVLGLAGFLLGGVAIFVAVGARKETETRWTDVQEMVKSDDESIAGIGGKLKALDGTYKDLARRVNGLDVGPKSSSDRVKALEDRVDALEKPRAGAAAAPPSGDAPKDAKAGGSSEEFDALEKRVFSGEATPDESAKFWQTLREKPEILAQVMKDLEKAVADNPHDADARMKLSRAYIAKLLTVPDGPEKGAWSMKAMAQYKAVLVDDPNHWDARYSLAFNYSQWPDFLNKRPDAVKEFETLRKVQEATTPEPKHAGTYFQLRQLYLKDGKTDDAKAVLEEGLRRFPDDEDLKKARDGAK